MKNVLKIEELALWGISIFGLYHFNAPWWCYLLLLLGPDISMLGYAGGNRIGAFTYNLFHHRAIAVLVYSIGFSTDNTMLQLTGIILFGHIAMDRFFGYGLKTMQGFKFTHLGTIGNK